MNPWMWKLAVDCKQEEAQPFTNGRPNIRVLIGIPGVRINKLETTVASPLHLTFTMGEQECGGGGGGRAQGRKIDCRRELHFYPVQFRPGCILLGFFIPCSHCKAENLSLFCSYSCCIWTHYSNSSFISSIYWVDFGVWTVCNYYWTGWWTKLILTTLTNCNPWWKQLIKFSQV